MTQATLDAPPATDLRAVRLDFVTCSFDVCHLDAVIEWATSRFGQPKAGKGMFLLKASQRYGDGRCVVLFDPPGEDRKPYAVLSITGDGCKHLDQDDLIQSIEEMRTQTGARCTRLDVAVDHLQSAFPCSIESIFNACKTGELLRARRFKHTVNFTTQGVLIGETLDIGRRGKDGSGRSVCLYDKGLESQTETTPGVWVRWETRFSDDCAEKAFEAYRLAESPSARMNIAYDAVEFRQVTGDQHADRRPFSDFYAKLKDGIEHCNTIKRTRKDSTAAGAIRWLNESVAPLLHYVSNQTGIGMDDLLSTLGSVSLKPGYTPKSHVVSLIEEITLGAFDDDGNVLPDVYSMLFERTIQEA